MPRKPKPPPEPETPLLKAMIAERTRGATFRAIAQQFNTSKSTVHRLLGDCAILIGPKVKTPPRPRPQYALVPNAEGWHDLKLIAHHLPPEKPKRRRKPSD